MPLYYLETSALVKLYIREPGTQKMLLLVNDVRNHRFTLLALARVEFHSAVGKRERQGDIDRSIARSLCERFDQHLETKFIKQIVNESLLDIATDFVDRYSLRAYDAIQLAGCATLKAASANEEPTFVCSDRPLLKAAELEGFICLDPAES